MPYGRPLRGLGAVPNTPYYHDAWAGADTATLQAAMDDDNVGNGIFDTVDAPPVQHAGSGVFEARYSEPGYLYRERMTQDNAMTDAAGNQVIFRPGGGGYSDDMDPTWREYDREVPRYYGTPQLPAPPTAVYDPTVPPSAMPMTLSTVPPVNFKAPAVPVKGLGALEGSAGYGSWAVGGLIIGVAGAIVYATLTMKK